MEDLLNRLVVPGILALTTAAFGFVVKGVKLIVNMKAERRLNQGSKAEMDAKLVTLFVSIMNIAHSRQDPVFSESLAKFLLENEIDGSKNLEQRVDWAIQKASVATPVGYAAQKAAIRSIADLSCKHTILANMGLRGLQALYAGQILKESDEEELHEMVRTIVKAKLKHDNPRSIFFQRVFRRQAVNKNIKDKVEKILTDAKSEREILQHPETRDEPRH